jgi:hypothetical protein
MSQWNIQVDKMKRRQLFSEILAPKRPSVMGIHFRLRLADSAPSYAPATRHNALPLY